MPRLLVLFLFCACATEKAVHKTDCQLTLERCNNGCFRAPKFRHGGPQCTETTIGQVCPQENQLVDTVEAGKCFEKCEWDAKLCQ